MRRCRLLFGNVGYKRLHDMEVAFKVDQEHEEASLLELHLHNKNAHVCERNQQILWKK